MYHGWRKTACLVAFGGNALIKKGQEGTAEEQFDNLSFPMGLIAQLSTKYKIVITHGNGPQMGNLLLQQESCKLVPKMPSLSTVVLPPWMWMIRT